MSSTNPDPTPIQQFGQSMSARVERWMPSPFLFAIILTYVAAVAAFLSEGAGATELALSWFGGFWSLLEFGMQMVLILVTAFVVAYHPWVKRGIDRLIRIPNTGRQSILLVGFIAMVTGWISWGLGLIVGAIFAREMGELAERKGMAVHYPLLCVAGYLGMSLTWHWGLSSSAGLLMNTPGNVFIEQGVVDGVISTTQTIFHPYALILTATSIVYALILLYLLSPPKDNARGISEYVDVDLEDDEFADDPTDAADAPDDSGVAADGGEDASPTPADRINNSKVLGGIIALTGVAVTGYTFLTQGLGALDLNVLNFGFIMVGLALYTSPIDYLEEFYEAVQSSAGIILQFPFYAGIIGIMTGTGLVDTVTEFLISIATPQTFPVIAWITAGILNIFVPSGGGEWTIIGGSMLEAGEALGVEPGHTIMAYAVGDAHTNLFQPFWAIPLLAITGMRARDMFGYAITMLLLLTPFLAVILYVLPYNVF
ncbi:short-chain fatty acid transporter [Halorubrum sp. JWXQ-INN 858]|uniref:short-chain fatty acid transporter n=1 Tax=Halorubrum sp. JWXQ-INN 858 TaxID=2690782 RepID=UPI001356D835|nr:TIGR00366 family protein [Halorubrum sp. JWXQ-INN 858]MWV65955.1 short-chain fatty acid transporter [Halorubrum sp. JWXQ-INN 858]